MDGMTIITGLRRLLRRNRPGRHHIADSPTVPIGMRRGPNYQVVDTVGRPVGKHAARQPGNRGRHARD